LFLALFVLSSNWGPDTLMAKAGYYPVVKVKKDLRPHPTCGPELSLGAVSIEWPRDTRVSFLKVERNRNLGLWLLLASHLIRSPPTLDSL
jgi:hypothetical protein